MALGIALGLDRVSLLALYRGGYLHDVGKVGIPDSILFKPGKLTAEEWVTMRSHHCPRRSDLPPSAISIQSCRSFVTTMSGGTAPDTPTDCAATRSPCWRGFCRSPTSMMR